MQEAGTWVLAVLGYPVVTALPLVMLAYIVYRTVRERRVSALSVAVVLSVAPALTPFVSRVLGYDTYTAMNRSLQSDKELVVGAITLILAFTLAMIMGERLAARRQEKISSESIIFSAPVMTVAILASVGISLAFLESSSVWSTGYGEVKQSQGAGSSVAQQAINGAFAFFLAAPVSQSRRRVLIFGYVAVALIALLYSRRTLALGIAILAAYVFGGQRFRARHWAMLAGAGVLLLLVGEVRAVGISQYLAGARADGLANAYSMPGGGANIFVSALGVLDLTESGRLAFPDTTPILRWFDGVYAGEIYASYGYSYNGGMHVASEAYWNFGVAGVLVVGAIAGVVLARSDQILRNLGMHAGTLRAMMSAAFVLLLPITMWYGSLALINLELAVVVAFVMVVIVRMSLHKSARLEIGPKARSK